MTVHDPPPLNAGKPADNLAGSRAFTDTVRRWRETHKGRLAVLRRNAGNTLADAHGVVWFYDLLDRFSRGQNSGSQDRDSDLLFLVATLLAFDRAALEGRAFSGNFGRTMAALKAAPGTNEETVARRFAILLDCTLAPESAGEMAFRLRQTVRLVLSKGVGIDWPQLLYDLRGWSLPDKRVQKCWARHFYAPLAPDPSNFEQPSSSQHIPDTGDYDHAD